MSQQPTTPHLSWLFVAFLSDGSTIEQDQADTPKEQPEGSSFSDVQAHINDVVAFELRHENGDKAITVDLKTGAFIVNGIPLHAHNQHFDPEKYPLKLIYFRETRAEQDILGTVLDNGTISQERVGNPRHFVNRYFIGWETEVNGKNKQITLAVG